MLIAAPAAVKVVAISAAVLGAVFGWKKKKGNPWYKRLISAALFGAAAGTIAYFGGMAVAGVAAGGSVGASLIAAGKATGGMIAGVGSGLWKYKTLAGAAAAGFLGWRYKDDIKRGLKKGVNWLKWVAGGVIIYALLSKKKQNEEGKRHEDDEYYSKSDAIGY